MSAQASELFVLGYGWQAQLFCLMAVFLFRSSLDYWPAPLELLHGCRLASSLL